MLRLLDETGNGRSLSLLALISRLRSYKGVKFHCLLGLILETYHMLLLVLGLVCLLDGLVMAPRTVLGLDIHLADVLFVGFLGPLGVEALVDLCRDPAGLCGRRAVLQG